MNVPDVWSLLTGLASVISLFLTVPEKYANWRRHLLPVATGLGGFAVGRLSFTVAAGADLLLSDPVGSRTLILILVVLLILASFAYLFLRRGDAWLAYVVIFLAIITPSSELMRSFTEKRDLVSVDDYVLLASGKAQTQQFDTALRYLTAAKKAAANDDMRASIDRQIKLVTEQASKAKLP